MSDIAKQYSMFREVAERVLEETNANHYQVTLMVHYDNSEFSYVMSNPNLDVVSLNCDTTDESTLTTRLEEFIQNSV